MILISRFQSNMIDNIIHQIITTNKSLSYNAILSKNNNMY